MKIVLMEDLGVDPKIIEEQKEKLKKMGHELVCYEKSVDPKPQVEETKGADAIILANMPLDPRVLSENADLKYIDVAFTGVDHIPMKEAEEKGILVSNASGYATEAVAELVIAFMIDLLRNVTKTETKCREGQTKAGLVGNVLQGKTIGIVGVGAIGKRVAQLCKAFNCTILGYNRSTIQDPNVDEQVDLESLLERSDLVSLHVPLTQDTRHMIDEDALAKMKKSAYLINTARGAVVDQEALVKALEQGTIQGAALDVFEQEPPLDPYDPILCAPNTIVTPHIAFASKESMEHRAQIVFDNLYAWLEGHPTHLVQ